MLLLLASVGPPRPPTRRAVVNLVDYLTFQHTVNVLFVYNIDYRYLLIASTKDVLRMYVRM